MHWLIITFAVIGVCFVLFLIIIFIINWLDTIKQSSKSKKQLATPTEPEEKSVQVQDKFDYTGYAIEYHPYKDSYYIVRTNNGKFKYLCEGEYDSYDFCEYIDSDVFEFNSVSNAMYKLKVYLETVHKQGVTIIEIK